MATILVVDDDPDARLILDRVLRHAGHETCVVPDGTEAAEIAARVHPAVAIVDIFMPGKDGIETIVELRKRCPETRIIAISAGWNVGNWLRYEGDAFDVLKVAANVGADRMLTKPVDPDRICEEVAALIAGRGMGD